jgi:molecular chaperone GrpE
MERTVESLEQDIKTEHNMYLRALADFENYRRRVDRERSHFGRETLREFVISLLDVVDDLERMLNFVEGESSPFIDGVRAVYRKLMTLLEKESIHPFDSVGKLFDPAQHEAVATAPADENTMGTIVQEVRKGYLWEDELLRTAQVVVAA